MWGLRYVLYFCHLKQFIAHKNKTAAAPIYDLYCIFASQLQPVWDVAKQTIRLVEVPLTIGAPHF